MSSNDRQLGFLPLAHIAGRMFYVFSVIQAESEVHLVESLETMNNDIQEVEPTAHFAVPRVWEKTIFGNHNHAEGLDSSRAVGV